MSRQRPNQLLPPENLHRFDWFVLVYDRDAGRFLLQLVDKSSYEIEESETGYRYLARALNGDLELAERCFDTARNFVACACFPEYKDVIACPERFVKQRTEIEIMFDEKNQKPWPELLAHRGNRHHE